MQRQPAEEDLYKFDKTSEEMLLRELKQNKAMMFDILEKAPKIGVYKNQDKADWQTFFKFYMDFLRSQIGPRGVCAKKIRKELIAREQRANKLLEPFNLKATTHIREIYMKIKNFVPCDQYLQLIKLQESREKYFSNIQRFEDESSPMVKAITEGLVKKHGTQFDIKTQLLCLKENYIKKLKESDEILTKLRSVLDKCQSYHHLMEAQAFLQPYFKQWKAADAEMGRQNCKTGQLFEQKVFQKILPYLIFKETNQKDWHYQKHKLQVFTNSPWVPKSLGEIDIALGYKDQKLNRYFITTLIECKSRFFDLRQAYRQVSLDGQPDINKGPTFEELKAQKKMKIKIQREKSKAGSREKANNEPKVGPQPSDDGDGQKIGEGEDKKEKGQCKQGDKQQKSEITKKFLSTKYGLAELVQNHHFYIITTLPQNQFVLPIESKMKEGIDKFTKNMFIEDIQSQPLFNALLERFEGVLSPLDWIRDYEAQWKGEDSNILVLK